MQQNVTVTPADIIRLCLIVSALSGVLFLVLFFVPGLDLAVSTGQRRWFTDLGLAAGSPLASILGNVTYLGNWLLIVVLGIGFFGYWAAIGEWRLALFAIAVIASGALFGDLIKSVIDRPRPDAITHMVKTSTSSFPSGHALGGMVTYMTVASLLALRFRPRRPWFGIYAALVLAILIGLSRIYLGVHWPSDVAAGWGLGSLWTALAIVIYQSFISRKP